MKTKRKQPLIRFKGFNEDWEEKKLGEIADVTMGQSPSSKNYTLDPNDRILVQGNADLRNGYVFPRIWTKEITKEAHIGDTLLSVRAPVGDVARTQYDVVIGRGVAAIKKDDFIYHFLDKTNKSNYWKVVSTGSTFESVSSLDIKNLSVKFPYLEEKNKISNMLNNLDKLIFLQEQKLELLNQVKKGLLQKLFPKKGSKVPEVRFRGFEGEWRSIKLSEISRIRTGKLNANVMVENGKYDFYTSGIEKYKIDEYAFEGPAITIAGNGATVGYMHIADGKFNAYQRTYVLDNLELDRIFMFYLINKKLPNKIFNEARMGSIPYIVKDMLDDLIIDYSTQEENRKIGNIISVFNNNIKYNNSKLQQLQAMKQSLLQQMFI